MDLKAQQRAIRQRLDGLLDERAAARAEFDSRKAKLHAAIKANPAKSMTELPEFAAAEQAKAKADGINARYEDATEDERRLLALFGQTSASGTNGPEDGTDITAANLSETPGALMSSMLGRRRADIPQLPHEIRAATVDGVMSDVTTRSESAAIINLLMPRSVALASGIGQIRIETTETRVPKITERPQAGWIAELGTFPKSGPSLDWVTVKPGKCGLVMGLSIETFDDLTPALLAVVQEQLLRAVALEFDAGILFGDGEDDVPLGVFSTPGIETINATRNDLVGFTQAVASLLGENAQPGALVMNPYDFGSMLELTEESDSLVPLIKAQLKAGGPIELPFFLPPVWLTTAAPEGEAGMYDPAVIAAVIRKQVDVAIDPYYDFDHGEVGLRVYIRGDVVVGNPEGVKKITFPLPGY